MIICLAAAYYWGDSLAGRRPKFRTLPVMRGELFIGVTATGTVEPVEIIDVGAQIVGQRQEFRPGPGPARARRSTTAAGSRKGRCWRSWTTCLTKAELDEGPRPIAACRGGR